MARPAYTEAEEARIRGQIVDVARALFIERGVEGVTMRGVASRVGCSPMRLYRYFPNKRALLRNVWEEAFVRVFGEIDRALARRRSPRVALKTFARVYATYWFEHPDEYRLIFLNEDSIVDEGEQYYVDGSDTLKRFGRLRELFEEAMQRGLVHGGDAELMSQQLLCAIHGVMHLLITVPEYPWRDGDRVLDGVIEAMLGGFAA